MSINKNCDKSLSERMDELIKIKMEGNYATLARLSGVSSSTIHSISKGTEPKAYTLIKIAKALGVTSDYLIEGIGKPTETQKISKRAEKIAELIEELDSEDQKKILSDIKDKKLLKELRNNKNNVQKKSA